jgi:ABC-type polysaccharide/polyol phosphate export permease
MFYEHRWPHWRALAIVTLGSLLLFAVAASVFESRREEFAELV